MSETSQLIRILEGALFASEVPLSVNQLMTLFDETECPEREKIHEALTELAHYYLGRGIELKELASGYQFQVCADLSKWMQRMQEDKPPRYSRAVMETLALIAYRQPITRGEIEEIRGVAASSNIIKGLLERDWVKIIGYRDVPGRPALLATTKIFLDYFGLKRLDELPPLSEIEDLEKAGQQLEQQLNEGRQSELAIGQQEMEQEFIESKTNDDREKAADADKNEIDEADGLVEDLDLDETDAIFAEVDAALQQAAAKMDAFVHREVPAVVEEEDGSRS